MESRIPLLPKGFSCITVVLAVPPIDHPDHEELSRILRHPWIRQLAAGNHLNPNLNPNQPGEKPWN